MKKIVKLTLLFFWLATIMSPCVFSILDLDNEMVVNTMSEEEPTKQEKKDPTEEQEEKIVHVNAADFSLLYSLKESSKGDFYFAEYGDYTIEIHLPPPERIV